MADGVATERYEGTPQGGPLSPLLANVLLDEVDKELEKRGHAFVRYAEPIDWNGKPAEFVVENLVGLDDLLGRRKFLGYSFWVAPGRQIRRRVASKSIEAMKERVRELTPRTRGRSLRAIIAEMRPYLQGWKQYFQLADTPL